MSPCYCWNIRHIDMERIERIHFLAQADKLKPLRQLVKDTASDLGCSETNLDCIVMAINEACMNIIQHAYQDDENGEIIVEIWKAYEEMIIRIYDFAEKIDCKKIKSRDLDDLRPGGLGVHLIHKVMDSVDYKNINDNFGNLLELRKVISDKNFCTLQLKEEHDEISGI